MPRALSPALAVLLTLASAASAQTPGVALNQPGWTWTNAAEGSVPWSVVSAAQAHDGTLALRSGPMGASGKSAIRTTVTGPGILTWWARTSTEADFDVLTLTMDNAALDRRSGLTDWTLVETLLPAGVHIMEWAYQTDTTATAGENAVWLDEVAFTPAPAGPSLEAALDAGAAEGITWLNTSAIPWTAWNLPGLAHDGTDCVISPRSENSLLRAQVSGPAILTWWSRIDSLNGREQVEWTSTGSTQSLSQAIVPDENGWSRMEVALYPGPHEVRWKLTPNTLYDPFPLSPLPPSRTGGGLALDQVQLTPLPVVPIAEALDTPALTWTVKKNGVPVTTGLLWAGVTGCFGLAAGEDAMVHARLPSGSTDIQTLETNLSGPCLVRFKTDDVSRFDVRVDGAAAGCYPRETHGFGDQCEVMIRRGGPHVFQFVPRAGGSSFRLDAFEVLPAGTSLAAALDAPGLTWRVTNGAGADLSLTTADWQGLTLNYSDDSSFFRFFLSRSRTGNEDAVWIENLSPSRLETAVTGPGTIHWRGIGPLSLSVDGVVVSPRQAPNTTGWENWFFRINTPGPHTLRWQTPSGTGAHLAALSDVQWSPLTVIPPEAALDAPGLTFSAVNISGFTDSGSTWTDGDAMEAACSPQNEPRISTSLTGPVWLNFRWMREGTASQPVMERAAGNSAGAVYLNADGRVPQECAVFFPAGPAAPVWRWLGSDNTMWLDAVSTGPAPEIVSALEAAESCQAWQAEPMLWPRVTDVSFDGADAVRAPAVPEGQSAILRAGFTGPGRITWRSRTALAQPGSLSASSLSVSVTGGVHTENGHPDSEGEFPWWLNEVLIGDALPCQVTWSARDDGAARNGLPPAAWLDALTFTPFPAVSVAAALDSSLTWSVSPSSVFTAHESPSAADGADQITYTPLAGDPAVPVLSATVTGPGRFSFKVRVLDANFYGRLRVLLNGAQALNLNFIERTGWQEFLVPVNTTGTTIAVRLEASSSTGGSPTRVALDQFVWQPLPVLNLTTALDAPGLTWSGGTLNEWTGDPGSGFFDAVDGAVCRVPGKELSTTLTGPVSLRYRWKSAAGKDTGTFYPQGYSSAAMEGTLRELRNNGAPSTWHTDGYDFLTPAVWPVYWTTNNTPGSDLQIDQVEVFTPPSVSVAEGMDLPGNTVTVSSAAVVKGYATIATGTGQDVALLSLPYSTTNSTHWLETSITGPGILTWKATAPFAVTLNGAAAAVHVPPGGNVFLRQYWTRLPAGTQTVRWTYANTTPYNAKAVLLDACELLTEVPLAEALDQPALTFTASVTPSTDGAWFTPLTPQAPADSTDAAVLVTANTQTTAKLTTTFHGRQRLGFTLSLPASGYTAQLYDNDTWVRSLANGTTSVTFSAGPHAVEWRFEPGYPSEPVYVDGITLEPVTLPPAPVTLDWPGLTLTPGTVATGAPDLHQGGTAALLTPPPGGKAGIEAAATGPCVLSLWVNAGTGIVTVLVDDAEIPSFTDTAAVDGWKEIRAWQPLAGTHRLTVQSATAFAADGFSIAPVSVVDPGTAAAADATLTLSGGAGITGINNAATTGSGDAALLLRGTSSAPVTMSAMVTGPASLEHWILYWPQSGGYAKLAMDGASLTLSAEEGNRPAPPGAHWHRYLNHIPAGTHTLAWQTQTQPQNSTKPADVWMDDVRVIPDTPASLAEAVDLPEGSFTAGPEGAWQGWNSPSLGLYNDGDYDGAIVTTGGGTAWLEASFNGPAWVSLSATNTSGGATVTTRVDGQPLQSPWISGAGPHVLRITFTGGSAALSTVRIRQPLRELSLTEFLPAPTALFAGDTADVWRAFEFPPDTADWLSGMALINSRHDLSPQRSRRALEFSLPGPGLVTASMGELTFLDGRRIDPGFWLTEQLRGLPVTGPGPHKLRWEWPPSNYPLTIVIPSFSLIPATVTLAAAFNVPGASVISGGDKQWSPLPPGNSGISGHLLASPPLSSGELSWLEAQLTGPGFLTFQWVLQGSAYELRPVLDLDGVPFPDMPPNYEWKTVTVPVPPGVHKVRWTAISDAGRQSSASVGPLAIAGVSFQSAPVPARDENYAAALEADPSLTFTAAPATRVSSGNAGTPDDFVTFASFPGHEPAWLETTITGPARVNFKMKDRLRVRDGAHLLFAPLYTYSTWTTGSFDLGPGSHVIRWETPLPPYDSSLFPSNTAFLSTGSLDALTIAPLSAADTPPQDAVDWPLGFSETPGADFHGQSAVTRDGVDALYFTNYTLTFTASGPGRLSFYLRNVPSLAPYPQTVAAVPESAPDENGWQRWTLTLPPGTSRFRSQIEYPASAPFYMDAVSFTPSTGSLAEALEAPSLPWTTGGTTAWAPVSVPGQTGDAADAAASPAGAGVSWIETTVSGPGTLHFYIQSLANYASQAVVFTVDGNPLPVQVRALPKLNAVNITGPGPHRIRWLGGEAWDMFGTQVNLDRVRFIPDTGDESFTAWLATAGFAGNQGLPDLDADGFDPLVEYAFDLSLLTPDDSAATHRLPVSSVVETAGEPHLSLTWHRRCNDPALTYIPEFGDNTQVFTPANNPPLTVTPLDDLWEEVTVTDPVPLSAAHRRFARVRLLWHETVTP